MSEKKGSVEVQPVLKWHFMPEEDVFSKLETDSNGLTSAEAAARLAKYGKNQPPEAKIRNPVVIFLNQFVSPLIFVLIVAAVLSAFVKDIRDAIFIAATLLLNACIGTYQELKAEKNAKALRNLVRIKVRVVRDGGVSEKDASELVPGDVVLLESGSRVPADIRLFSINNLAVDESLLTGESLPDNKETGLMPEDARVVDMNNMVFAGTIITTGRAKGVVTGTGQYTELGKIASTMKESKTGKSPLMQRMEKFSGQVVIITLCACAAVASILLLRDYPPVEVIFAVIALAVSAIPEGLPLALTIAMSTASSRMAKRNVLVRNITAVESLGSCTFIASDKTGTLTVNQQTVKEIILWDGTVFKVTGEGYNGNGEISGAPDMTGLKKMAFAACICNEGELQKKDGKWEHSGDSIDVGFLAFAYKAGIDPNEARRSVKITQIIPYESEKKYSGAVYEQNGATVKCYKGALEAVASLCNSKQDERYAVEADKMAAEGYRVLAVAEDRGSGINILGLACFMDPLRPESIESINICRKAGIDVAMLTGDHPATATHIGQELGIIKQGEKAVTGRDLEVLNKEELTEKANSYKLFARVSPVQKLQIIEALMKKGHFVAVTGDGANDAPALKKANLGVAMGTGTDIAKDTSSMIITDDNFSSIVAGVEEGRVAYDNIRKVIYMLLSTGFAGIVLFILAVAAKTDIPLVAIQLLWLNTVTSVLQTIALAFEKKEEGIMERAPRPPGQGIFDGQMRAELITAATYIGCCAFFIWTHFLPLLGEFGARNMTLLFLVLAQNVQVINSRSETKSVFKMNFFSNPKLIIVIVGTQLVHIAAMHIPVMQDVLRVEPIEILSWAKALLLALSIIPVMEVFKIIMRARKNRLAKSQTATN